MRRLLNYISVVGLLALAVACTPNVPENARDNNKTVDIFPDYTDVYVPYNIAPLNFHINSDADEYVSVVESKDGKQLIAGGRDVCWNESEWHEMLQANKGGELTVDVYVRMGDVWEHYKPFKIYVTDEPIDDYLSYRLIEPGYKNYGEIALCQRNLTNYDESVIIDNKQMSRQNPVNEYQCLNCHSYQNYRTNNFQFHARQYKGGTVIVHDGKAEKVNLKTDATISAGVYPAWHPTEPVIAYSLNHTVQAFVINDADHKIEVLDTLSDIVLYYIDSHEIQVVQQGKDSFETSPAWSPTGDKLYYSTAYFPIETDDTHYTLGNKYDALYYDIVCQSYDAGTRQLGEPDTILKASDMKKSASFPRISPDGRYLLVGLADFGYFHVWHKSSDLYVMDLTTRELRPLTAMNSPEVESYHAWSSNGRWIVFSTRRDDGNYTRPYIGYFDKQGKEHKPFALPQKDPLYHKKLLKSFNVPEFMIEPVGISPQELVSALNREQINSKIYNKK